MRIDKVGLWETLFLLVSCFLLLCVRSNALEMNAKVIKHFERETVRCASEVLKQPGEFSGINYRVILTGQKIHGTPIKHASILFNDLDESALKKLSKEGLYFSTLKQTGKIEVEAMIEANAIQNLITREINRVSKGRRIFEDVTLDLGHDKVNISGKVNLQKVPGNPFVFLPQQMSPFAANVCVKVSGSQVILAIFDGQMNNQPLTPELSKMLLDWLNPLWDFNALPYDALLDELKVTPAGVEFSGSLF